MNKANLGDYLLWKGKLSKVIAIARRPTIVIEQVEDRCCPECGYNLGKEQFSVIPESPLFQESAEPITTITTD